MKKKTPRALSLVLALALSLAAAAQEPLHSPRGIRRPLPPSTPKRSPPR